MTTTLFERVENFNGINVPVSATFSSYDCDSQYVVVNFSDYHDHNFERYYNPCVIIKDMHISCKFRGDTRLSIGGNTTLHGFTIEDALEWANMIVEELHELLTLRAK